MKTIKLFLLAAATFLSLILTAQINGSSLVCSGQVETYNANQAASSYSWSVTGALSYTSAGNSIDIEWGSSGSGTVTLISFLQNGNTTNHSINVAIVNRPNPVIISSFTTECLDGPDNRKDSCLAVCEQTPTIFSGKYVAGNTYNWELLGDGVFTTTTNANEIEVTWNTIGLKYIKLTVTNGSGCSNSFTSCVKVLEKPVAIIETVPLSANVSIPFVKMQLCF